MGEEQCEYRGVLQGCEGVAICVGIFRSGRRKNGYLCGVCLHHFEGKRIRGCNGYRVLEGKIGNEAKLGYLSTSLESACSATGLVAAGSWGVAASATGGVAAVPCGLRGGLQLPAFVIDDVGSEDDEVGSEDEADCLYEGCQKGEVVKVAKRNYYECFLKAVKDIMEHEHICGMKGHINLATMIVELKVKGRMRGELIGEWRLDGDSRNGESNHHAQSKDNDGERTRKPAGPINDGRFLQAKALRVIACDNCGKESRGNGAGCFLHTPQYSDTKERIAGADRKDAWESGRWDATWVCSRCRQLPGYLTNRMVLKQA